MSKEKYSIEKLVRIYDNKEGDYYEVGPDSDGLGMLEIRKYTSTGEIEVSIAEDVERMEMIATCILQGKLQEIADAGNDSDPQERLDKVIAVLESIRVIGDDIKDKNEGFAYRRCYDMIKEAIE